MANMIREMRPVAQGLGSPTPEATTQVITFVVGGVSYGIGISLVREVQAWTGASPMPGTPCYVRGIINLRGTIIPIIDLRARFSQGLTEAGEEHVLVIVVINESRFGILVDGVSEIITVSGDAIRSLPEGCSYNKDDFLIGLVMNGQDVHALLDAKSVVGVH